MRPAAVLRAGLAALDHLIARIPRPLWWAGVFVCALIILYIGGRPASDLPRAPTMPGMDKLMHGLGYAGMAACVFRAVFPLRAAARAPRPMAMALVVLVPLVVGIVDEWNQSFSPGRSSDPADVVADAAGGAIVLAVGLVWRAAVRRRDERRRTAR